jgi:hypothetical protein
MAREDAVAARLKPLGEHAYPAFQLYCAAEDHLAAAKSMTVLSRELLLVVNDVAAKVAEKPRIMSVMFGYAARLSAELGRSSTSWSATVTSSAASTPPTGWRRPLRRRADGRRGIRAGRQAWLPGRQAGLRPVRPMSRSSSGASSGTLTGRPNRPSLPSGFCATACCTNS